MRRGVIFLCLTALVGCSKVPSGHVGIKVNLLGGSKGVDTEELGVGRYWIGMNEELHIFPTFTQNYVWTKEESEGSGRDESFNFQTKEGMVVGADFGVSYRIIPNKVHDIFQRYRKGVDEITSIYLRNEVRDAINTIASTMQVHEVYGEGKAKFIKEVNEEVKSQMMPIGIQVEDIYLIGNFRLPESVTRALNAKIESMQRGEQRENELREEQAEAQKKIARAKGVAEAQIAAAKGEAEAMLLRAEAEADANRMLTKSLTRELIEYQKVNKWNGTLPQVTSGNALIDLRK